MTSIKQKLIKKTYICGNLTLSTMNRRFTFFPIKRGNETVGIIALANFMIDRPPYNGFYTQLVKASLFISSSFPEEDKIDCVNVLCDFLNDNKLTLHYICEVDNINKKSKKKEFKSGLNENNTSPYYVLENFSHIYIGDDRRVHFCSKKKIKMLHDSNIEYTIRESHKAPHFALPHETLKNSDKRYFYINRSDYLRDYSFEPYNKNNTTNTNMKLYIDRDIFIDNGPIILPRHHYNRSREEYGKMGVIRIVDIKDGNFVSHPIDMSNIEMESGDIFIQRLKLSIKDFIASLEHIKDKFDCYIPFVNTNARHLLLYGPCFYNVKNLCKKEWIKMVRNKNFFSENYTLVSPENFHEIHEKGDKGIIFTSPIYNRNMECKESDIYMKDIFSSDDFLIEMPVICKKK